MATYKQVLELELTNYDRRIELITNSIALLKQASVPEKHYLSLIELLDTLKALREDTRFDLKYAD